MDKLLSTLGINLPLFISQLVNVIILLVVMRLVAYKPIMRMLDERSKKIKESMDQTEIVKQQAANAEQEVKKQLQGASHQGQEIIARATKSGEDIRLKAQEDAKKDAEMLITKARVEIKSERDEAIDELRREFADLTVMAAGKVIGKTLDKEAHRELIDKVLQESGSLKKG